MKKYLLVCFVAIATMSSCSKDDETPSLHINQKEVKLKYDGEFAFSIENASDITWTSSDEFVGIIGSDGKFEASHLGETIITGKTGGTSITAKVIVEPKITGVSEPYVDLGGSKANVKSYEKRSLGNETSEALIYVENSTYTRGAVYIFENNLFVAAGLLWNDTKISDAAIFYAERYEILGESDDIFYFRDKASKVIVGVTYDADLGLISMYSKYTTNNRMSQKFNIKAKKPAGFDNVIYSR